MTLFWLPSLEDLVPQWRKGTKEERELTVSVFTVRLFGSLFKKNKKANVAVSLLCCTKSFLETECEKEKYLAILRHLGYNYKKIKPTLVLFARREILILAMLTFSISQACLK